MNQKVKNINKADLSNKVESFPIVIHTKTFKPPVRKNYVERKILINQLENGLNLSFTIVSAATGYGKSVLVSQWLEKSSHDYGWLSLDKEHNNIYIFLNYFLYLLKKQYPQKNFGLESLLNTINIPLNLIINTIIVDLDKLEKLFVFVLDDYHIISEENIHEIINTILRYPPEHFHLVILTQRDPPFELAKMRSRFRLNELRMKDLVFTTDEALKLRSLISSKAKNNEVETLVQKTEGWVTGITVGLMGLGQGISFNKVLEALHSRNSVISDLLDEAILNGLPIETQKYLELLSLIEKFSEDLINSMVAAIDDKDLNRVRVEDLINISKKRNLFLIPLDNKGEWYRFHHLFQNQVNNRKEHHFNKDTVSVLYKAASSWFEEKAFFEEALTYALRSGDMDFSIGVFSRFRHQLLNSEQLQRLIRLTYKFPEEAINNNPELLLNLAMLQHYNANFSAMQEYILKAERHLNGFTEKDDHEKKLLGEYYGVKTYLSYMTGDFEKAIKNGEKCMELLPRDTPNFFREQSTGWYVFAQQASGHAKAGFDRLENEYQSLAKVESYFQMRLLQGKLIFYLFDGRITHLYRDGKSLSNLCSPELYPGSWVIGIYSMVYYFYINNNLDKTFAFHNELKKYRFACRPFWTIQHFFIECLSNMAESLWQKVDHCMAECIEFAEELAAEPLKGMVKAFQVEYYLRRNDIDSAREVSSLANFEPQPPTFFYYIPQLTHVKLLYHTNQKAKSKTLLQNLLEIGKLRHNKNLLTQALVLKAVIYNSEGNNDAAKKALNEVLLLTKETKNIRVFLDHGENIYHMLKEKAYNEPENNQVIELLRAFAGIKLEKYKVDPKSTFNLDRKNQLINLTKRELEILNLIDLGLKNDEIAEKLFISIDTVKKHLYRTYQKLETTNRVGAIKKAKVYGLMTSNL